jgi:hypothetical protein
MLLAASFGVNLRARHGAILKRILQLHDEEFSVLETCEAIMNRVDFYQKYVSLSRNYNVGLPGRFIVSEGGQLTEKAFSRTASIPKKLRGCLNFSR